MRPSADANLRSHKVDFSSRLCGDIQRSRPFKSHHVFAKWPSYFTEMLQSPSCLVLCTNNQCMSVFQALRPLPLHFIVLCPLKSGLKTASHNPQSVTFLQEQPGIFGVFVVDWDSSSWWHLLPVIWQNYKHNPSNYSITICAIFWRKCGRLIIYVHEKWYLCILKISSQKGSTFLLIVLKYLKVKVEFSASSEIDWWHKDKRLFLLKQVWCIKFVYQSEPSLCQALICIKLKLIFRNNLNSLKRITIQTISKTQWQKRS